MEYVTSCIILQEYKGVATLHKEEFCYSAAKKGCWNIPFLTIRTERELVFSITLKQALCHLFFSLREYVTTETHVRSPTGVESLWTESFLIRPSLVPSPSPDSYWKLL